METVAVCPANTVEPVTVPLLIYLTLEPLHSCAASTGAYGALQQRPLLDIKTKERQLLWEGKDFRHCPCASLSFDY